jgi:hypothetical protein
MAQLEVTAKTLPGKAGSVYLAVAPYLPRSPMAPPKAFLPARMRQVPLSLAAMPVRLLYLPVPVPPTTPAPPPLPATAPPLAKNDPAAFTNVA